MMMTRWSKRSYAIVQVIFGIFGLVLGGVSGLLVVGVPDALKLFVIVVGLFAFVVSLARVDWGLLVLLFISYTRFSDVVVQYHGAPSVAKSFVLLLLLAIAARWVVYGEKPEGWQKPAVLMFAYAVIIFSSILYAADPERTQAATISFVKDALILVIISVLLYSGEQLRRVIWALMAAGIFLGTLSVIQYLTKSYNENFWGFAQAPRMHIIGETSGPRISGPFGSPNVFAQVMLVLIPLSLDRFWNEESRWARLIAGYGFAIITLTVVFTFSRSGFVALVFVMGLLLLYYRPKFTALLTLLVAGVFLIQFIPQQYVARIKTLALLTPASDYNPQYEVSFRGRASEVMVGWMMFRDNPILGVGKENYPVYYQEYSRKVGIDPRTEQRSPHNLYIEVLAEQGILGFVFFALILWYALRDIIQSRKRLLERDEHRYAGMVTSFGIGFLGFLVASLFIHSSYPRFLWILVGIAYAMPRVADHEIADIEPEYQDLG